MLTTTVARFARVLVASLLLAGGCFVDTEVDTSIDYEQVVLDFGDTRLLGGIGMDDVGTGPCACGDSYTCLSEWADDNFNCGVCVSIACGSYNADICTDLCGPIPITGGQPIDMKR